MNEIDRAEERKRRHREASRRFRERNPEAVRLTQARHYRKHRREILEKKRIAYPRYRSVQAEWRLANPEKQRLITMVVNANAHARALGVPGRIRYQDIAGLPRTCTYCGTKEGVGLDHAIPLIRGGTNERANVVPSCLRCNDRKGRRTRDEFERVRGA